MSARGDVETDQPTEKELGARSGLVHALSAEVDRQLVSVESRASAMSTRASILVGAAGIVTGLQLPAAPGASVWFLLAVAAAASAAILGVTALLPGKGNEVPVLEAERTFWNYSTPKAVWVLAHWKLATLKAQEKRLRTRSFVLLVGFGALGTSLTLTVIYLLTEWSTH